MNGEAHPLNQAGLSPEAKGTPPLDLSTMEMIYAWAQNHKVKPVLGHYWWKRGWYEPSRIAAVFLLIRQRLKMFVRSLICRFYQKNPC